MAPHDARACLQFLALAEKQTATMPLIVGNRLVGTSLACTGDMRKDGCIWIGQLRFIIRRNIAHWR